MLIRSKRGWELPERTATPESVFHNRRRLIKGLAAGSIVAAAPALLTACDQDTTQAAQAAEKAANEVDPSAGLYPVQRNLRYKLDRPVTDEEYATTYNNYYEFRIIQEHMAKGAGAADPALGDYPGRPGGKADRDWV